MMPISKIKIGDIFQRKYPFTNLYYVMEIDTSEKMVKVQAYNDISINPISEPFWMKGNNSLFSEQFKIKDKFGE